MLGISSEAVVAGSGRFTFQYPSHGRGCQMQTRAGEKPGDPDLAHAGAQGLQAPHDESDEVVEAVDGFGQLHKGMWPLLIDTPISRCHGLWRDEHGFGCLDLVPSARRPQFQDGHALRGWIVRAPVGCDLSHAGVLDMEFLTQQRDLLARRLQLCRQTGARAKASGSPRPRVDTGEPRQGDDVEQGGLDVAVPGIGEKQVRTTVVFGQISLRKKL